MFCIIFGFADSPKSVHVYTRTRLVLILAVRGKAYLVHHTDAMELSTGVDKRPGGRGKGCGLREGIEVS